MNKFVKFLSATLAGCMMMTSFAGAVNLDAVAEEPAEETLTGTATIITEDGVTYQNFEYTIPEGATEDEADEIILQAAEEAASIAPVSRATSYRDCVGRDNNFWIPADSMHIFTCDPLWDSGGFLEVLLDRVSSSNYVNISCNEASYNRVRVQQGDASVIFYDGRSYGGVTCWLDVGSEPELTFYADRESLNCRLRVYHNY